MEVEPIRNLSDIVAIHRVLTKWGNVREAEAFIVHCRENPVIFSRWDESIS